MTKIQNQKETISGCRKSKSFYKDLITYILFSFLFIAIWFFSGKGDFWPIWPILGWGISIAIGGVQLVTKVCGKD